MMTAVETFCDLIGGPWSNNLCEEHKPCKGLKVTQKTVAACFAESKARAEGPTWQQMIVIAVA